jgi:hypothetical protein
LKTQVSERLAAASKEEGLNSAIGKLGTSGEFTFLGNEFWGKLIKNLLDDTNVETLTKQLKEPGRLDTILTGIKNNWGKLLISGVTFEVVTVWLATGGGIQDLVNAVANVVDDTAKNLIGALAGVAKSLTDPIGSGIGSALKTTGIILGVVVGIGLLIYVIYLIIKKVRADNAKKKGA